MSDHASRSSADAAAAYLRAELSRLVGPALDDYLAHLAAHPGRMLRQAECLSSWLDNGCYRLLRDHWRGGWRREDVAVARVRLTWCGPEVEARVRPHGRRLAPSLGDATLADILGYDEARPVPPELTPFLARVDGDGDYTLIDGNHRAFRLARGGARSLPLIFPVLPEVPDGR